MGCANGKNGDSRRDTLHKKPAFGVVEEQKETKLKLCMAGNMNVGKSVFYHNYFGTISKFVQGTTAGSGDNNCKKIDMPGHGHVMVSIWDTAGQERYASITKIFFKGADGIIILFDVTSRETFNKVEDYWVNQLRGELNLDEVVVCLIGNKTDLPNRVVTQAEAEAYAASRKFIYKEASALQNKGVTESVNAAIERILAKKGPSTQ
jgi:Ras-related protein Rab-18